MTRDPSFNASDAGADKDEEDEEGQEDDEEEEEEDDDDSGVSYEATDEEEDDIVEGVPAVEEEEDDDPDRDPDSDLNPDPSRPSAGEEGAGAFCFGSNGMLVVVRCGNLVLELLVAHYHWLTHKIKINRGNTG